MSKEKDQYQLGEKIKQSVLSTFIDSNLKSDPRASLSYSLNENTGALKFIDWFK